MKFQFTAVDSGGRIVRGVMRAENEEEARELLLGEDVFPKKLNEVGEEEKVTWSPKGRIKAKVADAATWNKGAAKIDSNIDDLLLTTTAVTGFDRPLQGAAGLNADGDFVFQPRQDGETLVVRPSELEILSISGFPRRLLRLTLLSGRMYEFTAGLFLSTANAKAIVRQLSANVKKET